MWVCVCMSVVRSTCIVYSIYVCSTSGAKINPNLPLLLQESIQVYTSEHVVANKMSIGGCSYSIVAIMVTSTNFERCGAHHLLATM